VKAAYLDGELYALRPDGVPAFSRVQAAMDEGRTDDLVFIVFDLLYLNGKSTALLPLIVRKERLRSLFAAAAGLLHRGWTTALRWARRQDLRTRSSNV
jgi:ATP-dependent DNA ligase